MIEATRLPLVPEMVPAAATPTTSRTIAPGPLVGIVSCGSHSASAAQDLEDLVLLTTRAAIIFGMAIGRPRSLPPWR